MLTISNLINGPFGALVMVITGILSILCFQLWLTFVAFTVRWWWGLTVFFVPFGALLFTVLNWKDAKKPFCVAATFLSIAIVMFVLRSLFATFFDLPPSGVIM